MERDIFPAPHSEENYRVLLEKLKVFTLAWLCGFWRMSPYPIFGTVGGCSLRS
jgi:hypothetical protein